MARGSLTFRQRDVTAAINAARAAGLTVTRVEVDKHGTITISANLAATSALSELDRELAEFESHHEDQAQRRTHSRG
jgi:hypothetical protein